MNENGTEAFSGTEGQLIVTETQIEIMDLSPGSVYAFTVKVTLELVDVTNLFTNIILRLSHLRVRVISP